MLVSKFLESWSCFRH